MAWERLAHTELTSTADSIDSGTFTAKKNLKVIVYTKGTNIETQLRFNSDSSANYAANRENNGGSETDFTGQTMSKNNATGAGTATYMIAEIYNRQDEPKAAFVQQISVETAGAGNAPLRSQGCFKYQNTSAQITSIQVINNGTGDFAAGSYITVLGAKEATTADSISITGMEAKKFLKIQAHLISDEANTGSGVGSKGINTRIRVNGDSGSNYARRMDGEGTGYTNEGTSVNQDHLHIVDEDEFDRFTVIHVVNQDNQEKIFMAQTVGAASNGTAVPSLIEAVGKWANTSNQITSIEFYNTGNGSFVEGSEVVVYGTD